MMFPLVRDLAAPTAPLRVPVTVTCWVLKFSTQAFYKWLANPVSQRDWDDAHLINAAPDLHGDDPEFGYRLLADELRLKGFTASENRVWRLCSQQRIFSVHSRKRGLSRKPGPPVHDDLLERDFNADTINIKWLTDITEHPTGEGKLYLCAIKDCASNRIVGYSLDPRMTSELAVTALRNALALRSPDGTIVHSDRGSQGGFKWSSQHLDEGGVAWAFERDSEPFSSTWGRSRHRDVRRWRGGRIGSGSGRPSAWGDDRGRGGCGRRVLASGVPLVPPRWRRESCAASYGLGPVPVVRRTRRHRDLARPAARGS